MFFLLMVVFFCVFCLASEEVQILFLDGNLFLLAIFEKSRCQHVETEICNVTKPRSRFRNLTSTAMMLRSDGVAWVDKKIRPRWCFFYCFFCFLVCIPIWGRFLIWGYDPI